MDVSFKSDKVIQYLIELKDEIGRIKEKKFQKLIEVLSAYEISDDDDYVLPNRKDLAKALNVSDSSLNQLLKKLYYSLMQDFVMNPLEIKESKQIIHIHIPYDEHKKEIIKKDPDHYYKFSTFIEVKMPYIPRIGEIIDVSFLEHYKFITRGYVNNVQYKIQGNRMEVYIEAHPFDNDYARWEKLKEKYENEKRWKEYLKRQEMNIK